MLAMIAYCFALGKSRKVYATTYYKLTLLALLQNRFGKLFFDKTSNSKGYGLKV